MRLLPHLTQLFDLLQRLFELNPEPDWNSLTTIWIQSENYEACADAMTQLYISGDMAEVYQMAFDVAEVATQNFVEDMKKRISDQGRDRVHVAGKTSEVRRPGDCHLPVLADSHILPVLPWQRCDRDFGWFCEC